jgi:hypothetical protein
VRLLQTDCAPAILTGEVLVTPPYRPVNPDRIKWGTRLTD